MRLTAELISTSLSFLNPLKERELDLRGHKIPTIENLAVAGPQDAIDFTDNDITILGNFPLSPRLRTLLLARNRLTTIQSTLATSLPNLTVLILTQNNIAELADLEPLGKCTKLTHLSVLENPVTRREHFRSYLLYLLPTLRFLNYTKVRAAEREQARQLFGTPSEPTDLATKISGIKSRTSAAGAAATATFDTNSANYGNDRGGAGKDYRVQLTAKERKRVEKMIRNAKSLAEIARLEKDLNEGRVPGGILLAEDEDDEEE